MSFSSILVLKFVEGMVIFSSSSSSARSVDSGSEF
jgi:hypothetical protein